LTIAEFCLIVFINNLYNKGQGFFDDLDVGTSVQEAPEKFPLMIAIQHNQSDLAPRFSPRQRE